MLVVVLLYDLLSECLLGNLLVGWLVDWFIGQVVVW